MFAPSTSRPPYFTPHVQLAWTTDDELEQTLQRPRTAQSPPPFQTEPSARPTTRRKRKAATQQHGKRTSKLIHTQPPPHLTAALNTACLLHTLSIAVQDTATPTQTTLQTLYNDLLTVASHPSTQQGVSSNGRHKHALMLRLILSSVLWVEMQGRGKEELDLFDNCCSHLTGLLVLAVNGRASQSDDGAVVRAKRTERPLGPLGGKLTVAEELHVYRTAMLARALPQCLQNNTRTLYHISLVGVSTDWAALSALLPSLPHLHHLHVQQCDIADVAAGGLLTALNGSGVTHLSLSANRLTDAIVHPLCRLILSQGLRREDIEWQCRLRLNEQLPSQRNRRRRSEGKVNEVKSEAIREQGLLSVDVSGNCITDNGMLRLIDTLADDCWLLAVLLHDNMHSEKAVAAFFRMLAHNTSLLHYSVMPVTPAPLMSGFPSSSPRSRPTSPRGVSSSMSSSTSSSSSSARFWSTMSSLSDSHFHIRTAGLAELHRRQLLLCPRLTLNDQSAARFGHGMRGGQRDAKLVPAAESNRLLAVVETARLVAWDSILRQRQDDMRSVQRADSRPTSPTRPHTTRPLSPPAAYARPTSAASSSSIQSSIRPPAAAVHSVSAGRGRPHTSGPHEQPSSALAGKRAGGAIKSLPLALLDSLFKQLEGVDTASTSASPQPDVQHNNTDTHAHTTLQSMHGEQPLPSQPSEQQAQTTVGVKEAEEQKQCESELQADEAEWRELRQWANQQQTKELSFAQSDSSGSTERLVESKEELQHKRHDSDDSHSSVRPSGQLLSLADLMEDD